MHFSRLLGLIQACSVIAIPLVSQTETETRSLSSRAGKTYLNIGQNYASEWDSFASRVKTPAGISVYGDIYGGELNTDSQNILTRYAGSHSGNVVVGLSWKDAMTFNGYTQFQGAKLCNDITSGKFDANLRKFAQYLGRFPNVKYLLRIDYEVSGNLFANTNPSGFDSSTFDLTAYPKAFAHVRQVISGVISNVQYVFHPVRGSASMLYPGDNVVDLQGFSIFNNDVCLPVGPTTNCEGQTLDPNVLADIKFAKKPKIIAESAVQPPASRDPNTIITYLTRVKSMVETYDFAGWTYINSDWNAHGWDAATWGDSRIETNAPVLQWFQQNILSNSRYTFG
ncbi:putative endoglucanase H [Rosellinia necatrix]|uniref:Putative endoglucanase H n=1 Tax=Rosellinia necatrix TaxID=77044 RepID=A0A1W2TSN7_ROSNE|nr:putative endoglucanase H [Rosellinia necatrix]